MLALARVSATVAPRSALFSPTRSVTSSDCTPPPQLVTAFAAPAVSPDKPVIVLVTAITAATAAPAILFLIVFILVTSFYPRNSFHILQFKTDFSHFTSGKFMLQLSILFDMAIISYCCSKIKRFAPKKFSCDFVKIIQVSTHFAAFSIASVNFKRFFRQSARENMQKICRHPLTKMPAYLCTSLLKFVVIFS